MGHDAGRFSRLSHGLFTSQILPSAVRNRDYYHFHGLPPALVKRWATTLKISSAFALLSGLVMYETWFQNFHFSHLSVREQWEKKKNFLPAYQVHYNKDRVVTWNVEVLWDSIKDNVRGV